MLASFELPPFLQIMTEALIESFSAIYCTKQNAESNDVVNKNRGITLANSIRRRPNAFNLLHQMKVMRRGGYDTALQNLEAQENAASIASAYQIGQTEAGAATNLLKSVSVDTRADR